MCACVRVWLCTRVRVCVCVCTCVCTSMHMVYIRIYMHQYNANVKAIHVLYIAPVLYTVHKCMSYTCVLYICRSV